MSAPKRVQMTRQRPWRAEHPDAVIVARPSKWGNPYRVAEEGRTDAVDLFRGMLLGNWGEEHDYPLIHELAGRDLACWCPLDSPCHADVLLELANPKESDRA